MKGSASLGTRRHVVSLYSLGTPVPDGDGGSTYTQTALTPSTWHCSIDPATTRDLERVAAGTVIATASHILRGKYHPGVNTQTRIVFGTRTFNVTGIANLEERSIDMEVVAVEVVV